MPTSLETLVQYRAARADRHESRRVWLFHSHTYFDHAAPDCVAEARAFMDLIQRTFAATAHVEVSSFIPAPAGPHPRGSFEALFTREVFASAPDQVIVMQLACDRPGAISFTAALDSQLQHKVTSGITLVDLVGRAVAKGPHTNVPTTAPSTRMGTK